VSGIREAREVPWPELGILAVVLAELGRAVAAAQRYEDLRYRSACHEGMAPADIPRRILAEFYSVERSVQ
jgi:hypothetical protein